MNTEELYKRKLKLSTDITGAVSKLYDDFVQETGECPEYIGINLIDVTKVDSDRRIRAICNTDVDIRI